MSMKAWRRKRRLTGLALCMFAACTLGGVPAATPVANDAEVLANCPIEGDAKDAKTRALNELKRRRTVPANSDVDPRVTLAALVAPGDDTDRWDERQGASIEGYVADVKPGGIESVNCHTKNVAFRDTHIELTLKPNSNDESTYVIVEVTPQVRLEKEKQGVDWSTQTLRAKLKGRWVGVTGWLLFDFEHKANAKNTASGGAHIWRATVWEVHPISGIEVLPAKPATVAH